MTKNTEGGTSFPQLIKNVLEMISTPSLGSSIAFSLRSTTVPELSAWSTSLFFPISPTKSSERERERERERKREKERERERRGKHPPKQPLSHLSSLLLLPV